MIKKEEKFGKFDEETTEFILESIRKMIEIEDKRDAWTILNEAKTKVDYYYNRGKISLNDMQLFNENMMGFYKQKGNK